MQRRKDCAFGCYALYVSDEAADYNGSDLPSFRGGFEYIVSHSRSPDLYLIQRRDVEADGSRSKVKGMFFILQAKIYSSPTLYDVMNTRVVSCSPAIKEGYGHAERLGSQKNARFLLAETFQQLASSRPPSNPRVSSFWQALPPVASTSKSATVNASRPSGSSTPAVQSEIEAPVTQASVESRSRNDIDMDQLLYNALQSSHSRLVALEQQARVSRKASAAAPVKRMQDVMGMKGDISFLTATQGTSTVAGTPAAGGGLTQIGVRRMPSVTTMTLEALSSPMSLS